MGILIDLVNELIAHFNALKGYKERYVALKAEHDEAIALLNQAITAYE